MTVSMFDASNVGVGKGRAGGYSLIAPAGTDPTKFEDMTKTLAEFLEGDSKVEGAATGGYIDEDGVTQAVETNSEDHGEWSGSTVRSEVTSYTENVTVNFIESRESVLKAVFGEGNVSTNDDGVLVVRHNQNFTGEHVYVFDAVISDTKVKRSIIPRGVINERDDIANNNSNLIGYKPTIKCMADSTYYGGDTMREFIYDTTTKQTTEVTNEAASQSDSSSTKSTK